MSRAWRRWAVMACLALTGCTASARKEFTEGTRLKAVYQEVDGAPPRFVGWYDTVLGVDCAFADAGGVPERLVCFPTNPPLRGFNTIFGVATQYVTPYGGTYVPLVFIYGERGVVAIGPKPEEPCGAPIELFALDPELTDPASIFVKDPDGQIAPIDPKGELPRGLHRVGAEIPLDTLVTGAYKPGVGSGRIVPLTIVASDGSIQSAGTRGKIHTRNGGEEYFGVTSHFVAWDKERSEMVWAYYADQVQEGRRWFPETDTTVWGFTDDSCSVPAALGPACSFRARAVVTAWESSGARCEPSSPAFAEVGAGLPRGAVYQVAGVAQACVPLPDDHNPALNHALEAFTVGEPIPATAFAAPTRARVGTKQVQVVQATGVDGAELHPVGFFDTVHGVPCTARGPDQPCLPAALEVRDDPSALFGDAACSVPVVLLNDSCFVSKETAFVSRTERAPDWDGRGREPLGVRHIYALGERRPGPMYDKRSGPCMVVDSSLSPEEQQLFLIGAELPQSEFATVRLIRPE